MTVIEVQLERITPRRCDVGQPDATFADLKYGLIGGVPLHFCRRRIDAQQFDRKPVVITAGVIGLSRRRTAGICRGIDQFEFALRAVIVHVLRNRGVGQAGSPHTRGADRSRPPPTEGDVLLSSLQDVAGKVLVAR